MFSWDGLWPSTYNVLDHSLLQAKQGDRCLQARWLVHITNKVSSSIQQFDHMQFPALKGARNSLLQVKQLGWQVLDITNKVSDTSSDTQTGHLSPCQNLTLKLVNTPWGMRARLVMLPPPSSFLTGNFNPLLLNELIYLTICRYSIPNAKIKVSIYLSRSNMNIYQDVHYKWGRRRAGTLHLAHNYTGH